MLSTLGFEVQTGLHTVTPYGRSGGSSRVRVFDWLDHLGLDAESHDYVGLATNSPRVLGRHPWAIASAERDLRNLRHRVDSATVLLSKQASPFSQGAIEETLLRRASHGVYDFDDNLLEEQNPGQLRSAFPKSRIWSRAVRSADIVIAGNEYLADQATSIVGSGRVVVIPSCVDPSAYRVKTDFSVGATPRAIWLGSPSTEIQLLTLTESLLSVHRSHGLRLRLISAGEQDLGALHVMTDRVAWTPEAPTALADADVGLMPMSDSPQARGKCAYKLLQYGAAALPSIASPVGANIAAISAGVGVAASDPAQWVEALISIIEAPIEDRRATGERARSCVTHFYSFDSWATAWRRALNLAPSSQRP